MADIKEPIEIEFQCRYGIIRGLQWGSGHPNKILALHGWLDNAASFWHLAPLLAKDSYEITAIDFAGHGLSDHRAPGHSYQFVDYLIDLHEVTEQLHGTQWILLAHSMGAALAQAYLTAYPDKFSHLIMLENVGAIPTYQPSDAVSTLKQSLREWQNHNLNHKRYFETIDLAVKARQTATPMDTLLLRPLVSRGLKKTTAGYHWRTDKRLKLTSLYRFSEQQIQEFLSASVVHTHLILASPVSYALNYPCLKQRIDALKPQRLDYLEGDHHFHMTKSNDIYSIIKSSMKPV